MRSLSIGVLSLLAVLMVASVAAAQAQFTVSLAGPSDPVQVRGGQSTTVSLDITLMGDGFGCVQETAVPVNVTAGASRVTAAANPAGLTYTIPSGLHNSQIPADAAPPYNQTQSASVQIQAPSGQTSDFSTQVTVTAVFPGGNYGPNPTDPTGGGTCGPGEFPSAEGSASINVNVQADQAPPTGGNGGGGNGGDGGTPPPPGGNGSNGEDSDDSPLGVIAVPLGLLGAALIARRRRN